MASVQRRPDLPLIMKDPRARCACRALAHGCRGFGADERFDSSPGHEDHPTHRKEMILTKQDFQFIADVLSTVRAQPSANPDTTGRVLDRVVQEFANRIAVNNPRFDRHKFINAATVPANERE